MPQDKILCASLIKAPGAAIYIGNNIPNDYEKRENPTDAKLEARLGNLIKTNKAVFGMIRRTSEIYPSNQGL